MKKFYFGYCANDFYGSCSSTVYNMIFTAGIYKFVLNPFYLVLLYFFLADQDSGQFKEVVFVLPVGLY